MPTPLGSLYVCYLTIRDPLVETQVIAYVEGLAKAGHRMHLLTFEPKGSLSAEEEAAIREQLSSRGVTWHRARYRKRFSLPATILDAVSGAMTIAKLVRRHRLDLVHARSHVPAAMAMLASWIGGRLPFVFDIRGLMAEEYVDAGRWRAGGAPFRITKTVERRAIEACDGAVVLTEGARRLLLTGVERKPIEVIPCCVDLSHFEVGETRPPLEGSPTVAYVGKFGGWYMDDEMARVFARAQAQWPDARLMILTQGEREPIKVSLRKAGVDPGRVSIGSAPADEVGSKLREAHVGLSLVRPVPSKVASSPTKNAEYLAAGLPLLATPGVAGTDDLVASFPGTVVPIEEFHDAAIDAAIEELRAVLADPETGSRCRAAAESFSLESRGIPSYRRLYQAVGAALAP